MNKVCSCLYIKRMTRRSETLPSPRRRRGRACWTPRRRPPTERWRTSCDSSPASAGTQTKYSVKKKLSLNNLIVNYFFSFFKKNICRHFGGGGRVPARAQSRSVRQGERLDGKAGFFGPLLLHALLLVARGDAAAGRGERPGGGFDKIFLKNTMV